MKQLSCIVILDGLPLKLVLDEFHMGDDQGLLNTSRTNTKCELSCGTTKVRRALLGEGIYPIFGSARAITPYTIQFSRGLVWLGNNEHPDVIWPFLRT